MSVRRNDRLWLLGGVLAIVALVAAGYLLAIKPVYDDRSNTEASIADAQAQLVDLKRKLADLKKKSSDVQTFTARLEAKRDALPDNYDVPDFVRQLQDSGNAVDVEVSGFTFGIPAEVVGQSTVVGVPITLTATGTPADLSRFLTRLQNVQSRAVLINSAGLDQGDTAGTMTANLTLTAFCSHDPTTCKDPMKDK